MSPRKRSKAEVEELDDEVEDDEELDLEDLDDEADVDEEDVEEEDDDEGEDEEEPAPKKSKKKAASAKKKKAKASGTVGSSELAEALGTDGRNLRVMLRSKGVEKNENARYEWDSVDDALEELGFDDLEEAQDALKAARDERLEELKSRNAKKKKSKSKKVVDEDEDEDDDEDEDEGGGGGGAGTEEARRQEDSRQEDLDSHSCEGEEVAYIVRSAERGVGRRPSLWAHHMSNAPRASRVRVLRRCTSHRTSRGNRPWSPLVTFWNDAGTHEHTRNGGI